jgi:phosphomannomutase
VSELAKIFKAYDIRGIVLDELEPARWFNLRQSDTEPVLGLNVEAADDATLAVARDDVPGIVRSASAP